MRGITCVVFVAFVLDHGPKRSNGLFCDRRTFYLQVDEGLIFFKDRLDIGTVLATENIRVPPVIVKGSEPGTFVEANACCSSHEGQKLCQGS